MTIRKQIIRTFGIFAVIVSILVGSIYCVIYSRNYKNSVYDQLDERAAVSSQQMSDILSQMKLADQVLLSDQDILKAIRTLSSYHDTEDSYESLYFSDAYTAIRTGLNAYFIYENYYRIVFFNRNGVVVAGTNAVAGAVKADVSYEDLDWLDRVPEGKTVLIPCHTDDWGRNEAAVISLVMGIAGNNQGYIEVQWRKSDLDRYLKPGTEGGNILFYNMDGELVYAYEDPEEGVSYFPYLADADFSDIRMTVYDNGSTSGAHPFRDGTRFVSHTDYENGLIAVATLPTNVRESMGNLIPILILIVLAFLAAGMGYVVISSRRISRPITALSEIMEETNLDNLTEVSRPETESHPMGEEMENLYNSYFEALERLGDSIEKEKQLSVLQLEAQFGTLQAQVNPHFIYNILNVISSKGIMANDESICDICAALSRMLRYSTNTNEKEATLREEEEYLRTYLQLMNYRYEGMMEYEISIPERMMEIVMPKVTLEQIVENCFRHGFSDKTKIFKITVTGSGDERDWRISISDNGTGFSEETVTEFYKKFEDIRRRLTEDRQYIAMEIGGMGLVSVYARMYLVFGDALVFDIGSSEDGGAVVTIGAGKVKEDESDV